MNKCTAAGLMRMFSTFDFVLFNLQVCDEQIRLILRQQSGIWAISWRPPTGIVCQSVRAGWQAKVFAPWPMATSCWVSLLVREWSWEEALWESQRQNKSRSQFWFNFHVLEEQKWQRQKELISMHASVILYCCIMLDFQIFIFLLFTAWTISTFLTWFDI